MATKSAPKRGRPKKIEKIKTRKTSQKKEIVEKVIEQPVEEVKLEKKKMSPEIRQKMDETKEKLKQIRAGRKIKDLKIWSEAWECSGSTIEVAKYLGVSGSTLFDFIKDEEIKEGLGQPSEFLDAKRDVERRRQQLIYNAFQDLVSERSEKSILAGIKEVCGFNSARKAIEIKNKEYKLKLQEFELKQKAHNAKIHEFILKIAQNLKLKGESEEAIRDRVTKIAEQSNLFANEIQQS